MALSKIDIANMVTGITPLANGGTGATSFTAGITELDTWRVTTNFQGDVSPISSNWEREDDDSPINLGTGMSVSSGTWTFPSTGVWEITFVHNYSGAGDNQYIETF